MDLPLLEWNKTPGILAKALSLRSIHQSDGSMTVVSLLSQQLRVTLEDPYLRYWVQYKSAAEEK